MARLLNYIKVTAYSISSEWILKNFYSWSTYSFLFLQYMKTFAIFFLCYIYVMIEEVFKTKNTSTKIWYILAPLLVVHLLTSFCQFPYTYFVIETYILLPLKAVIFHIMAFKLSLEKKKNKITQKSLIAFLNFLYNISKIKKKSRLNNIPAYN